MKEKGPMEGPFFVFALSFSWDIIVYENRKLYVNK
jgi:hypothetical protein